MLKFTMRRVIPSRRARSSLLRSFISSQLSPIPIPCHCCYATSTLPFLNPRLLEVQPPINNSVAGPSHNPSSLAREHKAEHALAEAAHRLKSPHQLRLFFVYLLVNDYVKSPYTTWQTYQDIFSQDFILECDNINVGVNKALHTISRLLEEHGKSLGMYGLPDPNFHSPEVEEELKKWSSNPELLAARAGKAVAKLNAEQYKIYTQIMDAVSHNRPLCAFVDGKAGRGKTFLVTTICNKLRSMNRIVLPTATSGFAAQLYPGGRTTHSTFRVPITNEVKKDKKDNGSEGFLDVFSEDGIKIVEVFPEEVVDGSGNAEEFQMVSEDTLEELISPIEASDPRGELIREAAVIIWDEAPMAKRNVLACVDETCRRVMNNKLPFGGKVVILLGDFRQTCPVVKYGNRKQIVDSSIMSSPLWKGFSIYRLHQPIRNAEDLPYADFVDSIGDGAGPNIFLDMLDKVDNKDELIDFVYPDDVLRDPVRCLKRAILAPTNAQVNEYNKEILSRFDGDEHKYFAHDVLERPLMDEQGDEQGYHQSGRQDRAKKTYTVDEAALLLDIQSRTLPGIPAYALNVKVNGVYRIMCNLSPARGIVKNTRVVITAVTPHLITVRVLKGIAGVSTVRPEDIILSRITFTEVLESNHTLVRRQFPLAPAYATTFHSCQGLTLDVVGVDLTRRVFSHGQLYTALSRIRHRSHARVHLRPRHTYTQNVTFHEILP